MQGDTLPYAQKTLHVAESRRRNMAAIKSKDTVPELLIRRMLHRDGYRFRVHRKDLPGKPDIVFPSRRKAIEIRGCFWHRHPDPICCNNNLPKTRTDWWEAKLSANVFRDAANLKALSELGWNVLIVWECETKNIVNLQWRLTNFLGPAGQTDLS